jgi:uroporphyrin-III C-methyltransferase
MGSRGGVTATASEGSGVSRPAGRVWLVGAGPGDPELLTVKALRLLQTADVVLHDRLVSPAVLSLIPTGTLRIDVGKLGYGRSVAQARINGLLIEFAGTGHNVVRLKGGDPFVFGRGGEEALALRKAGIPVEVVPGVTAGVAGPSAAGIPLTHRGLARSVAFVTANTAPDGHPDQPDWKALARLDTLVVFMAGAATQNIAKALVAAGRAADTPTAVIVDATLPGQHVQLTNLQRLSAGPTDVRAQRPCLLVIGQVVGLAELIGIQVPSGGVAAVPALAASASEISVSPVGAPESGVPRTPRTAGAGRRESGSPGRP